MVSIPQEHLDATVRRLDLFDVGRPDGPDWHPLTDALDPAWMRARIARLAEGAGHGPRPNAVCGAYLGAELARAVVTPLAATIVTARRSLDVTLDDLHVRIDDDGWPVRMAVGDPRWVVLPDDPAAAGPGLTVVADEAALVGRTSAAVIDVFEPVLASVRAASRYGSAGLWGALTDQVAGVLWWLHDRGATPDELRRAWSVADSLVEAIRRLEPRAKARPRLFHLAEATPPVDLPMRGTCCLYYTTPEAAAGDGDGMCNTCPRRTDEERLALVNAYLAAPTGEA